MKKDKKQAVPAPGTETQTLWLSIAPGITVIAVVMLVLFAVVFALLWRSGMLPPYLGGIFSPSGSETESPASASAEISLGSNTDRTFSDENFFTPKFTDAAGNKDKIAEILRSIAGYDCYRQIIVVSHGENKSENVTICQNGEKYRVESEGKLVICDGETVYVRTEVNGYLQYETTWSAASGQFRPEDETGLSTLADILAEIEASSVVPEFGYDDSDKVITLDGVRDKTAVRSYGISYETGIVLFESAVTSGGEILYRRYTTSYTIDPEFAADTFAVPQSAE